MVFRVIGRDTDRGGTSPVVEVLDCIGVSLPSGPELQTCPIRRGKVVPDFGPFPANCIRQLFIGRVSEKQLPQERVQRLEMKSACAQSVSGFTGTGWTTLDNQLADIFGIE